MCTSPVPILESGKHRTCVWRRLCAWQSEVWPRMHVDCLLAWLLQFSNRDGMIPAPARPPPPPSLTGRRRGKSWHGPGLGGRAPAPRAGASCLLRLFTSLLPRKELCSWAGGHPAYEAERLVVNASKTGAPAHTCILAVWNWKHTAKSREQVPHEAGRSRLSLNASTVL
jgi:hypothetical protein